MRSPANPCCSSLVGISQSAQVTGLYQSQAGLPTVEARPCELKQEGVLLPLPSSSTYQTVRIPVTKFQGPASNESEQCRWGWVGGRGLALMAS